MKKKAIEDESDMVRGYAITALGDIGVAYPEHKREFIKFMEENLKNESEDWGKIHYYTELCRLGQSNYLTMLLEGLKNTDYSVRHAAINSLYPIFCTNNYGKIKQKCEAMLEAEKERAVRGAAQKLLETMERELS